MQDGQVAVRRQDLLLRAGGRQLLAPRVEDHAAAAVDGLTGRAAGIAAGKKHLVLDGPRRCQRAQVRVPHRRPLGHDEQQSHPLQRHRPRQLREADIVADENAAGNAVQLEPAQVIAGGKKVLLAHGRKQVRLVIRAQKTSCPVKDAGGIVYAPAARVGDASGDKIHAQLLCQRAEDRFGLRAVAVAERIQTLAREKAGVPCLRQDDDVGLLCRSLPDERFCPPEVFLRLGKGHVHLYAGKLHP